MANYKELTAWKKALDLSAVIYKFSSELPDSEKFGLKSQMQRCAVSVASNLAEGSQRGTKEFLHFINIALGSLAELDTQMRICQKVYYKDYPVFGDQILMEIEEVGKITHGLRKSLG